VWADEHSKAASGPRGEQVEHRNQCAAQVSLELDVRVAGGDVEPGEPGGVCAGKSQIYSGRNWACRSSEEVTGRSQTKPWQT
jgi:hypothetical protein